VVGVIDPAGLAVLAGKQKTAIDRRRWSRIRIFGVRVGLIISRLRIGPGGNDLIAERVFDGRVEATVQAIEPLLPWDLNVIAKTKVQGQTGIDLPVILPIDSIVGAGTIG